MLHIHPTFHQMNNLMNTVKLKLHRSSFLHSILVRMLLVMRKSGMSDMSDMDATSIWCPQQVVLVDFGEWHWHTTNGQHYTTADRQLSAWQAGWGSCHAQHAWLVADILARMSGVLARMSGGCCEETAVVEFGIYKLWSWSSPQYQTPVIKTATFHFIAVSSPQVSRPCRKLHTANIIGDGSV